MNRLSRLRLSGFKSIREMDLELGALNVLIGPNGAGKSNLLSFFRMLGAIAEQRLQLFVSGEGGANAIHRARQCGHGSRRGLRHNARGSRRMPLIANHPPEPARHAAVLARGHRPRPSPSAPPLVVSATSRSTRSASSRSRASSARSSSSVGRYI
jgi:energy-coupling factor transporter ATP-binding protein EcfA2